MAMVPVMEQTSALPWSASHRSDVHDADGNLVAVIVSWAQMRANAEFIVRACNAHEELLTALKDVRDLCAAAFRVIDAHGGPHVQGCARLPDELAAEVARTGSHVIGAGARADAAIAKAEGQ